jgi:hypothetical protein
LSTADAHLGRTVSQPVLLDGIGRPAWDAPSGWSQGSSWTRGLAGCMVPRVGQAALCAGLPTPHPRAVRGSPDPAPTRCARVSRPRTGCDRAVRGSPDPAQAVTAGLQQNRRPTVESSAGSGDPRRAPPNLTRVGPTFWPLELRRTSENTLAGPTAGPLAARHGAGLLSLGKCHQGASIPWQAERYEKASCSLPAYRSAAKLQRSSKSEIRNPKQVQSSKCQGST